MPDVFEQQRVLVRFAERGTIDLVSILRVIAACGQHTRDGYVLYGIEVIYERPQAVAAPQRRTQLPPTTEGEGL